MTLGDKALTAWSNLGRRKVRTALTSVGVVVGIMTIVTMVSLVTGVRLQVKRQFEEIGLERVVARPATAGGFGGFSPFNFSERIKLITPADVKRWKKWPGVQQVTPEVELPPSVTTVLRLNGKNQRVRVPGSANAFRGGPFQEERKALAGTMELPSGRGFVVLSKGALQRMKIGQKQFASLLGKRAEIVLQAPRGEKQSYPMRIVGITSDDNPVVQMGPQDRVAMKSWWFNQPNLLQTDGYDAVVLRANDVTAAKTLVARLRKESFEVQSIDIILDTANRIFSVITVMLALVGGIALFVASIGIVNTMIMSIYERTREIGTLKAMGASRGDIRLMFMIEAGLIGLIGGTIGLLFGWMLGRGLNRAALWYAHSRNIPIENDLFVITPMLAIQSLLFAFTIGVVAGLYPANRAASLDPLTALRHE
ncbi:MAG TPA: ABC transporter permease [Abditibacteriaceae bacterium]